MDPGAGVECGTGLSGASGGYSPSVAAISCASFASRRTRAIISSRTSSGGAIDRQLPTMLRMRRASITRARTRDDWSARWRKSMT